MKPRIRLAEAILPGGSAMGLYERDGDYSINLGGQELMHSRSCASELLLGEIGTENLDAGLAAKVLVGGLGLGFTLKRVLQRSGRQTLVEVAEIVPQVVEWNQRFLRELNGRLLDDPRARVRCEDVADRVRGAAPKTYDAILLDIDNGPVAIVASSNRWLYSEDGLNAIFSSLRPGGRAAFWSAGPDAPFERRLAKTRFAVSKRSAKTHAGAKRAAHLIYVADRPPR